MSQLQYEYVFTTKYQELCVRWFNPKTRTSSIQKFKTNEFIPPLYVPNPDGEYISHIDGKTKLSKITFNDYKTYKESLAKFKSTTIVHGNTSKAENFIRDYCSPSLSHSHDIHKFILDIEVRNEGTRGHAQPTDPFQKVSLIQVYSTFLNKFIILGVKEITKKFTSEFGEVIYVKFNSEEEMLMAFIQLCEKYNPAVISGYASNGYDTVYLTNRMKLLGLDYTRLSPMKQVEPVQRKSIAREVFF